jgi:poly(3-hydroxybutyrate) depolymerase
MIRGAGRRRAALLGVAVLGWSTVRAPDARALPAAVPPSEAAGVRFAFAPDGRIGAWLVTTLPDGARAPDEEHLEPRLDGVVASPGGPARWRVAACGDGALNLDEALETHVHGTAYAGGLVRAPRDGRYLLLLGVEGGLDVRVDGRLVFAREGSRPGRDAEDLVPLDLSAGDHVVLLALRRRMSAPAIDLRARLLDERLAPVPGPAWTLPGTTAADAVALAGRMTTVSFDRGMTALGYEPTLSVQLHEGFAVDAAIHVRAKLVHAGSGAAEEASVFDVDLGNVPLDAATAGRWTVTLPDLAAGDVEDEDWLLHVDVAGRSLALPFHPRQAIREATARATAALAHTEPSWLDPTSRASVAHVRDRLAAFVAHGDGDVGAQLDEARELTELASSLEALRDPYVPTGPFADPRAFRTGVMRRAYVSPADDNASEFAVYVPPDFSPARTYPLIVALHGMNGRPVEMIMWLFGHDDPAHAGEWEDRHPVRDLPLLEAVVVAPDGHFNTMYRDVGEEDVMRVVDWAMATYPIDPSRVTITGPSMGGIGAAAAALHHPDRFAAAEPLCGYHSYFVRSDIDARTLRPWELFLAEERSNVFWAENGMYLPIYVVHGLRDLPEENSGVLIDRYDELHYVVKQEHPDLGHNVWQTTYQDLKGAEWLLSHQRPAHPRAIRFKTPRTRWADDEWVHVRELSASDAWGEVTARIDPDNVVYVATRGVSAVALDRDVERIDDAAAVNVHADGKVIAFQAGEPIEMHREEGGWVGGARPHDGPYKHGRVTGPIRDVFHEPLLFVWGASDAMQARANEEAARGWARERWGVRVDYPVMSDTEFFARGEPLANDRALFLVGNARSNRVVRALEGDLPVRIDGDRVLLGQQVIEPADTGTGRGWSQLGVAFVRPNPRRPDRYVVVVEGASALGTWRSLSLPDVLPDYVVYDADVGPASGQLTLGGAKVRAAGFFDPSWRLPPPRQAAVAGL